MDRRIGAYGNDVLILLTSAAGTVWYQSEMIVSSPDWQEFIDIAAELGMLIGDVVWRWRA